MGEDMRVWKEERKEEEEHGKEDKRKKMAREGGVVTQIKKDGKKLKVEERGEGG